MSAKPTTRTGAAAPNAETATRTLKKAASLKATPRKAPEPVPEVDEEPEPEAAPLVPAKKAKPVTPAKPAVAAKPAAKPTMTKEQTAAKAQNIKTAAWLVQVLMAGAAEDMKPSFKRLLDQLMAVKIPTASMEVNPIEKGSSDAGDEAADELAAAQPTESSSTKPVDPAEFEKMHDRDSARVTRSKPPASDVCAASFGIKAKPKTVYHAVPMAKGAPDVEVSAPDAATAIRQAERARRKPTRSTGEAMT